MCSLMSWDLLMKTSVMSGSCLASLELVLVLHFKQALPFLKKHGVTF
uniref:Uncharacterized protein n=1 Tax=Mus musculus TaxID=10090 RepID=Q3V1C7_MOUSE|nr:unnamed protein product [Mus musculus]